MINNLIEPAYDLNELERKVLSSIRIGTIVEAKYDSEGYPGPDSPNWTNEDESGNYRGPLYRVEIGDGKTYWMPMAVQRACGDITYWAYEVGEQVLLVCISGDPMQSILIGSLYQNSQRPPIAAGQPTKDGRAWSPALKQTVFVDATYTEYRRSDDKNVPNEPRWLTKFLGAGNSLYQYEAHPEKRLLTVHIKETSILLDKDHNLRADNNITHSAGNDISHLAEHDISHSADNDISHTAKNNISHSAGNDVTVQATNKVSVTAGQSISIQGQSIALTAPDITLNSINLTLNTTTITATATSMTLNAGIGQIIISPMGVITIMSGLSQISLSPDGTIAINGLNVVIAGTETLALTSPNPSHGHT